MSRRGSMDGARTGCSYTGQVTFIDACFGGDQRPTTSMIANIERPLRTVCLIVLSDSGTVCGVTFSRASVVRFG